MKSCFLFFIFFFGSFLLVCVECSSQQTVILDSTVIKIHTVISDLDVPWEMIWGPDNKIWFTEQKGTISRMDPVSGQRKILVHVPDVYKKKSYGLLGMAMHPDFANSPYVYIDYTYLRDSTILSKLVRYTYAKDSLINPIILFSEIPGNTYHNGCRVVIAPDGKIMMSTGDAGNMPNAQDIHSLSGKILRINMDGSIPSDNPIPGSPVWSWGHRNPEGLVYGPNGILFSSEHGDASDDEVNIIQKGNNYGWPNVEGYCDRPDEKTFCIEHKITEPLKAWTPTIAPAGIDYYQSGAIPEWKNSILLTTLKGSAFHVLKLNSKGTAIVSDQKYLENVFGRLRDLCISPAGDIYISTSNRDWNPGEGFPKKHDDLIICLHHEKIVHGKVNTSQKNGVVSAITKLPLNSGQMIYTTYCASCHKKDGSGLQSVFPPLNNSSFVTGEKDRLISTLLNGLSGPTEVKGAKYNQQMPSFKFLNDKDIASVLTYIRSHFDNHVGSVETKQVSAVRAVKK